MELSIMQDRIDNKYYAKTYSVYEHMNCLYTGTYAQCLIYKGARSLGHNHEEAVGCAKGNMLVKQN